MRRVSGLILMILKSYSLPGSSGPALFSGPVAGRKLECPSSRRLRSSISVLWQSASMFSPNSTNAPNVAMRETLPFTICPTLCCLNQSPQMSLTCLMPSDTRRFSASIFSTFAVTGSPFLNTSCGFFTRPVQLTSPTCTSPSKPSSISTNAPNSAMFRTLPVTTVPTGYFSAISSQGSACACLIPNETRRSLGLMSSTTTSTSSPTLTTFEGCWIFLFQLISETCTRPSIPCSSSTNTPSSTTPTTLPFTFPPAGYFSAAPTQGSAISCFSPRDTRCFSLSNFRMMTSSSCSGFTTSEGCFTRPQLKSVKCSRPSIPPRSTNAPYSVTFFTCPCTTWPSLSVSINCARLACRSSSSSARRLTTTLPRRRFSFVIRTWISVPVRLSRFCAGRRSYCEPGKNARTPISTTTPPLMRSTILPVIVSFALNATSIFSHVRRRSTFRYDRIVKPSLCSPVRCTSIVLFGSGRGISVSVNSAAGISPSVFPPKSTTTPCSVYATTLTSITSCDAAASCFSSYCSSSLLISSEPAASSSAAADSASAVCASRFASAAA